jgi:hypothetical protein
MNAHRLRNIAISFELMLQLVVFGVSYASVFAAVALLMQIRYQEYPVKHIDSLITESYDTFQKNID